MLGAHRDDHFIFRGEDDAGYTLQPKYGRHNSSVRRDSLSIEKHMLNEFKRRGAPHVTHLPTNDWEWLAVAQHFGLATRLLDWTENPLVATFFATASDNLEDRVLYVLRKGDFPSANEVASPFKIRKVTMYMPKHMATRITAQSGVFTVHPQPASVFQHDALERWIIKSEAVIDIMITLDSYGFNSASVFPGLDGLALHVNDWSLRGKRK